MRDFFRNPPTPPIQASQATPTTVIDLDTVPVAMTFQQYKSDIESDEEEDSLDDLALETESEDESKLSDTQTHHRKTHLPHIESSSHDGFLVFPAPKPKRQKLDIPVCQAKAKKRAENRQKLESALKDITKLISSHHTEWEGNKTGQKRPLQSRRAEAIESHLKQVIRSGHGHMKASTVAAEYHGWGKTSGPHLIRSWVKAWVDARQLPDSSRGFHAKMESFLSDPIV